MGLEGALAVQLRLCEGRVAEVALSSTRRTDVAAALEGWRLDSALRLVPSLFAVCGTAQSVAATEAGEAALGIEVSSNQREARALLCTLESIDNGCFELGLHWAELAGLPPDATGVRRTREATAALRRWAVDGAGVSWGGGRVLARGSAGALVAQLQSALAHFAPDEGLTADEAALRHWAATSPVPAARALTAVYEAKAEDFGAAMVPLVPVLSADWYASRLGEPGFCARPTLGGSPAEAGALARVATHPVVAALAESHGRSLLTRLVARLVDLRALGKLAEHQAQNLHAEESAARILAAGTGRGTGVADTARGRVAHQVEVEQGRVVGWRAVAPTEWTFHPGGILREAVLGSSASGVQALTQWLIAALDPCVPCSVILMGK